MIHETVFSCFFKEIPTSGGGVEGCCSNLDQVLTNGTEPKMMDQCKLCGDECKRLRVHVLWE